MTTRGAASSAYVSKAPRLGFVGGFDGVRGIGILMVLFNHAYSDLSPSFAGIIDVFFVMSAFLIVTLLMQEHRDQHAINMRKFYARRAVRLLPSAYLCILAWVVFCLLFDRGRLAVLWQEAVAAVTYVYEFVFPVGLGSVDPSMVGKTSIDQFWSLALEEQFYLVIAVTVLVCIRKKWMTQLAVVLAVIAAWIGLQRYTGHAGPIPIPEHPNSHVFQRGVSLFWLSRPDSLMWGVGLAVLNSRLPDPLPDRWRRWLPRVGFVGLVVAGISMLLASRFLYDTTSKFGIPFPYVPMAPLTPVAGDSRIYWINFGHSVTALAFAPAMLAMARIKDWAPNRALSWKPLRFMGRMSYTVYVWHTFFYFVILEGLGMNEVLGQKTRAPILAAVTIVGCLPIFYGVEQRMLRVKLRFASEKEVLDLNTGKMVTLEEAAGRKPAAEPPAANEPPAADDPPPAAPTATGPDVDGGQR